MTEADGVSRSVADIEGLIASGRAREARAALERLLAAGVRSPRLWVLLGRAALGDQDAPAAEAAWRAGLKANPGHLELSLALSDFLAKTSRLDEARQVTEPLITQGQPPHAALAAHASNLKRGGDLAAALEVYRRAATLNPQSAVAHHNLAAILGDLGAHAEAEQSVRDAFRAGGAAAQTWLVYGRALTGLNRLEEAEQAFRRVLKAVPDHFEAHRDLAQLLWMRTADLQAATAALDYAIAGRPQQVDLLELRARILSHAGDDPQARLGLDRAVAHHPRAAGLRIAAARMAARTGDAPAALAHAQAAVELTGADPVSLSVLCEAHLAAAQPERAEMIAARLLERHPYDQGALAYQATAWRLLGDARYQALYDYDALVGIDLLDVPEEWASLDDFLCDLVEALGRLHAFKSHPLDQSVRHGSQVPHLTASSDPVIRAFFKTVDGSIRRYLGALVPGDDILRRRNRGGYQMQGAWSVRLGAGGFHTDHVHPDGWLSAVCYVTAPAELGRAGAHAGWLRFGAPGVATAPTLDADRYVHPTPGRIVLFPSYMWHGVETFTSEGTRLTIAFDLSPASP